jgi:hypothetical protein
MFSHILHTHYSAVKGFDWEDNAQRVSERNARSMAEQLSGAVQRATCVLTN